MASGPNTFATMAVFTAEKFQGNPLAIVSVHGNSLTQQRKSLIAKEFRCPATCFLHDAAGPGQPRTLEIFTDKGEELPFLGHPVIGAAHFIFIYLEKLQYGGPADRDNNRQTAVLLTKAGKIPIFFNPYRQIAACAVPTTFHVHAHQVPMERIISTQPHVQIVPTIDKEKGRTFPLVSIVKGLSFVLVDFTDNPELFATLEPGKAPEAELDQNWSPSFVGCMYYKLLAKSEQPGEPTIHNIQVRMMTNGTEDSGSGSGCSALACYLALHGPSEAKDPKPSDQDADLAKKAEDLKLEAKTERKVFGIQQGVEMGRVSTIAVEVDVKTDTDGSRSITNVILSGRASAMSEGKLLGF
ncbi:hypothetical protein A1O1_03343 [Capronia coronata CBS 617.96]|uniref:Phenazine biosynthesis protein n=1 Tax=Capronia coronata CBS 617.96 TaxID=1182541 RepID=W9Z6V2_9EURO|nr:uncharacterized protein A1O1_03343 [Capronia coronata CBS 617.96]EXJ90244.1 hypothetical protein A1O1_03343 [Capronia coronata CBS 617.96]